MKKSLIALAIASAVSAPAFAATSNVDIYGVLDMSIEVIDRDVANQDNEFNVASNVSRFGFKGAEDLGGGLSAVWQIEMGVGMDTGAYNNNARNTFLGLSSNSLGTVKVGRHDTAYKMSTEQFDVFKHGIGSYRTIMGQINGVNQFILRNNNTIVYESPVFMGFQGSASYSQNNEAGNTVIDRDDISLAVTYANGPLSAAAAYEIHNDQVAAGQDVDAWKLGAGYKFGNTKVNALYESIDSDLATGAGSRDAWYLSAIHTMGNIAIKGAYGQADETDNANSNNGADFWALGVDYSLSKRTTAYVIYSNLDNDTNATYQMGAGTTTGQTYGNIAGVGEDPSGFSVGLRHSF